MTRGTAYVEGAERKSKERAGFSAEFIKT